MNRKTYWGIAALILILIAAGGFIYYQWLGVQQFKEELAQDDKLLEEKKERVAKNKPPVAREGFKMVPHVQDTAAENRSESEEDWSDVTPEQRAQIEKMRAEQLAAYIAKWGEPPSPDASYQHYRDNHGDVHRHYRGTTAIQDYEYRTMFAPTPTELERYKQLRVALKDAVAADEINGGSRENPSPEVQRLNNEMKSLMDSAQREIPIPMGFVYLGGNNSGFPSDVELKRLDAIAIRDFYQRFEMEHLYELHQKPNQFYQKY